MGTYRLVEPRSALRDRLGLPEVPIPVREEVYGEIFSDGDVDLDALLDELDRFLDEHPEHLATYGPLVAGIAWVVGSEALRDGFLDVAVQAFATGTARNPADQSARLGLATALHASGRAPEALPYYAVVADEAGPGAALPRILGARAALEARRPDVADAFLAPLDGLALSEDAYWELRGAIREALAGREPGPIPRDSADQGILRDLTSEPEVDEWALLLRETGAGNAPGPAPEEAANGAPPTPASPGAPAPAAGPQAQAGKRFCGGCGAPLAEGTRFCGRCGRPA